MAHDRELILELLREKRDFWAEMLDEMGPRHAAAPDMRLDVARLNAEIARWCDAPPVTTRSNPPV